MIVSNLKANHVLITSYNHAQSIDDRAGGCCDDGGRGSTYAQFWHCELAYEHNPLTRRCHKPTKSCSSPITVLTVLILLVLHNGGCQCRREVLSVEFLILLLFVVKLASSEWTISKEFVYWSGYDSHLKACFGWNCYVVLEGKYYILDDIEH